MTLFHLPAHAAPSFSRYSIILIRMPFGTEAPSVTQETLGEAVVIPAESFVKTLTLCAITRNHDTGKSQIGLVDQATRKSYFLCEGDTVDGIELKEVDYEEEKALIKTGNREVWLTMKAGGVGTPAVVRNPFGIQSVASVQPLENPDEARVMTLASLSGETEPVDVTLKKHLISSQMELIRARGAKGPPLPMALTPEMDDQLVKEGLLAPTK